MNKSFKRRFGPTPVDEFEATPFVPYVPNGPKFRFPRYLSSLREHPVGWSQCHRNGDIVEGYTILGAKPIPSQWSVGWVYTVIDNVSGEVSRRRQLYRP
jgi:hypothetical protein